MSLALRLAMILITLACAAIFIFYPWWFPSPASAHADSIDRGLRLAISVLGALFVLAQLGLFLVLGFTSLFVAGGVSGPLLAHPALDAYVHDAFFVVAHFHLIMAMAGLFAVFAATYFWFPKMFGRMMSERLGTLHFWITLFGAYATFMPMHLLGLARHPRRYSELTGVQYVLALAPLEKFITVAAILTISGQLVFLMNFFWSLRKGPVAGANPWECTTLELILPSPTSACGLGENQPVVACDPYEYHSSLGSGFVMQNAAPRQGPEHI